MRASPEWGLVCLGCVGNTKYCPFALERIPKPQLRPFGRHSLVQKQGLPGSGESETEECWQSCPGAQMGAGLCGMTLSLI